MDHSKISFSVKKRERVVLKDNLFHGDEIEKGECDSDLISESRTIVALENGLIYGDDLPVKKAKKEYIIPPRHESNLKLIERLQKNVSDGIATESDKASLQLLIEAVTSKDDDEKPRVQQTDLIKQVENETGNLNPDYDLIPISAFGTAFLRGYGWNESYGIGKTNKKTVPLKISEPRPKGLGLGASLPSDVPTNLKDKKSNESKNPSAFLKENTSEKCDLKLNTKSYVKFLGGLNKESFGQVVSFDEENSSVFVKIFPSDKIVRVNKFSLEVVSFSNFKRNTVKK